MKPILFLVNDGWQKEINIGDLFILMNICYWKGTELGYESKDIFFEWPIRVRHFTDGDKARNLPCPPDNFLPINLVNKGSVNYDNFRIINFNKPNALYSGYKPIYTNRQYPLGGRNYVPFYSYLNKYFIDNKKRPELNIPKDTKNKYILFHYRNINPMGIEGHGVPFRNVNSSTIFNLFKIVQREFGNEYELWKCGEQLRALDKMFDYVVPYQSENLNDFLRVINNSSMLIGADSSPMSGAEILGIPRIRYDSRKLTKHGEPTWFTSGWWESRGGIGNNMFYWQNPDKQMTFWKDEELDVDRFLQFMRRWVK